jgi:hypothetical protein
VGYYLDLHEVTVSPYLDALPLSPPGRATLDRILEQLAARGDRFIGEAERRLAPGSDTFEVRWIFRDPGTKVFHNLRFIVSDIDVRFGVLRVVYAEDETAGGASPFP